MKTFLNPPQTGANALPVKAKIVCVIALFFLASFLRAQLVLEPPSETFYKKELTIARKVNGYIPIREADVIWAKRIWRIIDLREKLNLPLYYPETANMRGKSLFDVIKQGIMNNEIYAFDNPIFDDEFKTKMSAEKIKDMMFTETLIDQEDPDNPETFKTVKIINELTSANIKNWWVKEDWFFNKQSGTMEVRINGLCPLKEKLDPTTGEVLGYIPLFWVYFPQCQPILAKTEVYNTKNDAQRISYDDLFRKRMFSSIIFKESNVYDRNVGDYAIGIEGILETERIKEDIFNMEHDMWHL